MNNADNALLPRRKIILIGTDHRLQQSVAQDEQTKSWHPRKGGQRYRKLIYHCIERMGAKAILEEAHSEQDRIAPTIASLISRERDLDWKSIGLGQPSLRDVLLEPAFEEAARSRIKPEMLAGIDNLEVQKIREQFMLGTIMDWAGKYGCVLAIVGFAHAGVLARQIETTGVEVTSLIFTYPLVVDESRS